MKKALITGITGQDGSYLSDLLLTLEYKVYGLVRPKRDRHLTLPDDVILVEGDMTDSISLNDAIRSIQPDEVYNLAAQTFVPSSWTQPELTANVNALGVLRLLEAIYKHSPQSKVYQASTSEMYGNVGRGPYSETTPFHPRSPYGVAKLYGHHIAINYRESYGLHVVCGISFNHESPRRGSQFVTKKIAVAAAAKQPVALGNLNSKRDWGWAPDFVQGMYLAMQHKLADDYVFATGEHHSVREFAREAYACVGLDYKQYVKQDDSFIRPAEIHSLLGDYTKANSLLGWAPSIPFKELVTRMVRYEETQKHG